MSNKNGHTPEQPTSALDWRKPRTEGYLVQLPSGKVARVRPVGPEVFVTLKRIPMVIGDLLMGNDSTVEIDFTTPENLGQWIEVLDAITKGCFVVPKVVDNPVAEDEIALADVELLDKAFLFNLFGKPARAIETFCQQSFTVLAIVPTSKDDEPTGVPTAEHQPVGE